MKKKKSVSKKVMLRLLAAMLITNIISTIIVSIFVTSSYTDAEKSYMSEIANNISNNISSVMSEYLAITTTVAKTSSVGEFLLNSTRTQTMQSQENVSTITGDLKSIVNAFDGILSFALLDVEQDGYITQDGTYSDSSFSFASRPYYSAVTTRQPVITEPYLDNITNTMVVSVAAPVLYNNQSLGVVLTDISTDFVSNLVKSNSFKLTGQSIILDSSNNILANPDGKNIGQNISTLGYSDNSFTSAINSPNGQLITYNVNGETKMGCISSIGDLGWKIITEMDYLEFNEQIIIVEAILVGSQIITVLVTLFISLAVVNKLLAPLSQINETVQNLAHGELHKKLEVYTSDDEIGELSENLRATRQALASYIDEITKRLTDFGNGNFANTYSRNIEFVGAFKDIEVALDNSVRLMSGTLHNLRDTVYLVSSGANQVAMGSQGLAEGSNEQSASIQSLNELISNVTIIINETADGAMGVNDRAKAISEELTISNQQMHSLALSMEDIQQKSEKINTIIATIENIAFQTNLLALNASVEAARAGSAGKGFAVVADEVRNLASKTSEAVQDTTALIESTVMAVNEGNKLAVGTTESIQTVTNDVADFIIMVDKIAEASQEQAVAIEQIDNGVREISRVMETNSTISVESAATSEELSSQATVMKESIAQFKMK